MQSALSIEDVQPFRVEPRMGRRQAHVGRTSSQVVHGLSQGQETARVAVDHDSHGRFGVRQSYSGHDLVANVIA